MKYASAIFVLIVLALLSPVILANTGYCSKHSGWLSKREIVDRMLFGQKYGMSFEEQVAYAKEHNLGDYPNNCRLVGASSNLFTLFYKIDCVRIENSESQEEKYYYTMNSVDPCGINLNQFGESLSSRELYDHIVRLNAKYWNGD